jgi:hypothetical protein
VELAPAGVEDRRVRHVLGERVLEHVLEIAGGEPLVEELERGVDVE